MEKRIITVQDLIDKLQKIEDTTATLYVSINEIEYTPDMFDFTLLNLKDKGKVVLDLYR